MPSYLKELSESAESYRLAGLCVLPAVREGDQKRVALREWKPFQSQLPSRDQVYYWFERPQPGSAACIVCGAVSGNLEMIDFDLGGEAFEPWRERIEAEAPGLVERLFIESTPSGGRHVAYRCEEPVAPSAKLAYRVMEVSGPDEVLVGTKSIKPVQDRSGRWLATATLVETRGEGGLFLCAPSEGYEALQGWLTDLAVVTAAERELMLRHARALDEKPPEARPPEARSTARTPPAAAPDDADVERRALAYLAALPPAISGSGGHDATYRAATALVHGFGIARDRALALLEAHYNPRCVPPWSTRELEHKVEDAATRQHDRPLGWLRDAERPDAPPAGHQADVAGIMEQGRSARRPPRHVEMDPAESRGPEDPRDPGPFPARLLEVPGFVGRVMAYDLAIAPKPQPVLALAGAIALMATLAGRKVRDSRGSRTNLQIVGVAASSAGKENARKVVKRILVDAGAEALIGPEDLASDAAMLSALEISPTSVFLVDEFGRFIRTAADPRQSPHLYAVVTTLLKLYSSADIAMKAKGYSDAKRNKVIDQPCAVLYGTTVPSHLMESLTLDSLSDGFVGRLLFFEAADYGQYNDDHEEREAPEDLVRTARAWHAFRGQAGNLASEHPVPWRIEASPEAEARFRELRTLADAQPEGLGRAIWGRTLQKARQLALVHACSAADDPPPPALPGAPAPAWNAAIGLDAASWACELAAYLTRRMIWLAHVWIADGEFDRKQKRVMRFVNEAGGRIAHNDLVRKLQRMAPRERQEVIQNLLETGQLQSETETTGGRMKVTYASRERLQLPTFVNITPAVSGGTQAESTDLVGG